MYPIPIPIPLPPTAAAVLRAARQGARLRQQDLAERIGVAQSVISAYETGRRQPSWPTLLRLVEATAHELVLEVRPVPPSLAAMIGPVGRRLRTERAGIVAAAAGAGASNVHVFGDVARGLDDAGTVADLLVDLRPGADRRATMTVAGAILVEVGLRVRVHDAAWLTENGRRELANEAVAL